MDAEDLRRLILEKTGMSRYELDRLVERKIREFAGLLTELGALYTIARDLGIEIDIDRSLGTRKKLSNIKPGDQNVTVVGRITRVVGPLETEKGGKKIRYAVVYLYDGTGEARLVLWDKDADLVVSGKLKRGSVVEVIGARAEEFGGSLSLTLGLRGRLLIDPEDADVPPLPPPTHVSSLVPGSEAEVEIEIVRSFPVREKETNGRKVRYGGFIGRDESGEVRVVLWGDAAREYDVGARVRVFGRVKEGRRGLEIHVGPTGYVEVIRMPEVHFLFLDEVKEGLRGKFFATVVKVNSVTPYTGRCQVCGGKVTYEGGRFVCSVCGSTQVDVTPVLALTLDDGFARRKAVFFGSLALSIYGEAYPERAIERALELVGSDLFLEGVGRRNKKTGSVDIVVEKIHDVEYTEVVRLLLEEVKKKSGEKPER